jgi:hypothetical protein
MAHSGGRMTEEDEAFEELAKRQGDWSLQGSRKHQIMRYLENNAMREVQRLGQEIEQCQCPECQIKPHASDCAVHSEPAYPKGKCNCGAQTEQEPVAWPCLIDSADFSENTITLVMQCDDYKVSAGTHWLSTTPPKENT